MNYFQGPKINSLYSISTLLHYVQTKPLRRKDGCAFLLHFFHIPSEKIHRPVNSNKLSRNRIRIHFYNDVIQMYPYPAYSLRPVLCRSAPLSVERLRGRQQGEEGHRAQEQGHQEQEHQREGGPGQRKKSEKSYNLRIIAKIFRRAKSCNFLMFAMMYFPRTFTV